MAASYTVPGWRPIAARQIGDYGYSMLATQTSFPQRVPFSVSRRRALLLPVSMAIPFWSLPVLAGPAPVSVSERDVRVQRLGDGFTVEVDLLAPVPPSLAWAVLTDYEHMSAFMPNLSSSELVERDGSVLKVNEKGVARYGPFSSAFESIREIRLTPPTEIRSHGIGGSIKRSESVTRLQAEGTGTRLTYHSEVEPGVWFPPVVGPAVVKEQTARQFSAMLNEMLRRIP